MRKKMLSILMTGALALSMLAGCSTGGGVQAGGETQGEDEQKPEQAAVVETKQEKTKQGDTARTLKIFSHYGEDEKPSIDYAVRKVKEKYPNLEIEIEAHPRDDGQTLKTRAATGDLPDIMHVNAGDVAALSASGSLLVLDDYVKSSGYEDLLLDSAKDTPYYTDGKAYIFPDGGAQALLLYYNEKVFEDNNIKIPENYEELKEASEKLIEKDIIPCSIFAKEGFVIGGFFDMFAMKYNTGGLKALSEGKAHASDEGYSKAITKMMDLVNLGFFEAGATSTDYETAQNLFTTGQAAMFINGDWDISSLTEKLGDDLGYFESYPMADAGKEEEQNPYAFAGGFAYEGVAVSATTEDPDLVADAAAIFAKESMIGAYIYQAKIPKIISIDPDIKPEMEIPPLTIKEGEEISKMVFDTTWTHTLMNVEFATPFVETLQEMLTGMDTEDVITTIDDLVDSTN